MKKWKGCSLWLFVSLLVLILLLAGNYLVSRTEIRNLDREAKDQAGGDFISLGAGEVHYYLEGPEDAPLVVLIHGFSVPSYVWEPTSNYLNGAGYRTLRFDLYGRGYSDRPDLDYDIVLFTEQTAELIDQLDLSQPLTVVGLSMGAPIAARYAHQNSPDVNGVVLISPEVTQSSPADIFPLNIPLIGEYLMIAVMEPYLLPALQLADFIHPENYPEWERMYREQLQFKGTGRALLSTIRLLLKHNPEEEYRALSESGLPVILFWGEEDQTVDSEQIARLEGILPGMESNLVGGAGHLLHYEYPGKVNPGLVDFLDRIQ